MNHINEQEQNLICFSICFNDLHSYITHEDLQLFELFNDILYFYHVTSHRLLIYGHSTTNNAETQLLIFNVHCSSRSKIQLSYSSSMYIVPAGKESSLVSDLPTYIVPAALKSYPVTHLLHALFQLTYSS